ncbi:MAG: M48 family metallopeptidase [Granulosicoccus sp.]|nr:M48 family metallopeptidase [Granulosicoccus sp.]
MQMELGLDDDLPGLESYTVRISSRARNVNLRVVPVTGLEVTIPRRFPRREIPALLAENRVWIEKQLDKVRRETDPEFLVWPPQVLRLRAVGLTVSVICKETNSERVSARWQGDNLLVSGQLSQRTELLQAICDALKRKARQVLLPQLGALAREHNLSYKRCAVRGQKTVWGSYSSSGTLSLNYKLLFLPQDIVKYVLLHELAHTRYLDHSAQFWRFLSTLEPTALTLDRALGDAGKLVPPWLESA